MSERVNALLAAVALGALASPVALGEPGRTAKGRSQERDWPALQRLVEAERVRQAVPGMALAVVELGRPTFTAEFGLADVASGRPVTAETPFEVGSVTKPFTAALALSLVQAGKLSLDRPLRGLAPEFAGALAPLTLRQLLSHTGGVIDHPAETGEGTLAGYVGSLGPAELLLPPGRAFSYSNPGYSVVGRAIEAATGESYEAAGRQRLLEPLGMKASALSLSPALRQVMATGYAESKDGRLEPVVAGEDPRFRPAGTLVTTAADLARLARALLEGGRLDGKPVLPANLLERMARPVVASPGLPGQAHYGLGLFREERAGTELLWHDGTMNGYSASLWLVPRKGLAVVLLRNRTVDLDDLLDRVMAMLAGLSQRSPEGPGKATPWPAEEAREIVGTYHNRFDFEVVAGEGGPQISWFGERLPLERLARSHCRFTAPRLPQPQELIAVRDADGRLLGLQLYVWTFARVLRSPG